MSALAPRLAERRAADWFLRPARPKPSRSPLWPERSVHGFTVHSWPYRLAAWDWGDGPTVMLVHGWGGNAAQLARFVEPLRAAGFYVIAFDQPAHGSSTGDRASVIDLAEAVAAVGRKVGPVHGVIAHSLGASATAIAMSRGLEVDRAVFIAPPVEGARYAQRFARSLGLSDERARGTVEQVRRRVGSDFAALDLRRLAPRMNAPLLILHDPGDVEVPFEDAEAIAAAWPGARLRSLDGMGHRGPLRSNPVVAEAVQWLRGPRLEVVKKTA
jgi:pimeloyl-ACP methyl ester carboxylesterase